MKKFYQLLLAAILLMTGFAASAQEDMRSVTIKWDTPGSIQIQVLGQYIDLAADQTEVTVTRPKSDWANATVIPSAGYDLVSATYSGPKTGSLSKNYNGYYVISLSTYNECVVTVTTEQYSMDDELTINVINGAEKIYQVKLATTGLDITPTTDGTHKYKFCAEKDKELHFSPSNNFTPVSITIDGVPATKKWSWDGYYTIPIKNGSVIEYQGFEGSGPEKYEVLFQYLNQGKESLVSMYNRSTREQIELPVEKLEVTHGDILSFNFNEDYTVNKISVNGTTLGLFENSTSTIIEGPTTVIIDATAKTYSTNYVTAYISSPEGVEIYAGNRLKGEKVEINIDEATPMTEDINLPSSDVDGIVTMKADKTYKFKLAMSSKYPTYNIYTKDGYWLQTARTANTAKYADNPVSASTVYIAAKPIERNDKAIVYIQGPYERITLSPSAIYGSDRKITFEYEGYTEVDFEEIYESPYTVRTGAIINNMQVFLNNVAQARDENEVFSNIPVKNNSVLKIFADGKTHPLKSVTFTVEDGATADVTYDRVLTHTDLSQALQCYNGTEFAVTPGPKTDVLLNGEKLYPYEDGNCYFAVDETEPQHVVTLKYKGGDPRTYTLFPESGETVESLEAIRLAFPFAENAFLGEEFDPSDIMLAKSDWTWAASKCEIEPLYGADCPTFIISFPQAPTSLGHYRLVIPEGAFLLDGTTASAEIAAEYDLYFEVSGNLEYAIEPAGDLVADPWFLGGAFIFDESMTINDTTGLAAGTTIDFNGTTLTASQYSFEVWGNMLMFSVTDAELLGTPGKLHIHINAGAFKVNGQESPEIDHTWNVVEPKTYTFAFSPDIASGQSYKGSLETILITIPEAETAFIDNESGITLSENNYEANRYYERGKIEPITDATFAARNAGVTFKVTFNPAPTKMTEYKLFIAGTTFCCDGVQYPEPYTLYFTYSGTDGVEDITAGEFEDSTIYNLQGVRIESEWKDLPAGLYIRGGKKVLKH